MKFILNIIHLLYFFCLFLAEPVAMNCQETLCFLFKKVETCLFTVGYLASIAYVASSLHPPHALKFSLLAMPWIKSCTFRMRRAYTETYCQPYPLNHIPLFWRCSLPVGWHWTVLQGCCHTGAKLLLTCCHALQLTKLHALRSLYAQGGICICLRTVCFGWYMYMPEGRVVSGVVLGSFRGSFQTCTTSAH